MSHKILDGVRVLEYGEFVSAPFCGKLLADLGAEVTKIEPPGGDAARKRGPFLGDKPHPERSGLFLYLNTNKLGITLDISSSFGKEIFIKLVSEADILIVDKAPKFMENLSLTYDHLSQLTPKLIMTWITSFGKNGPYRDYKMYPLNTFHAGGEGYCIPGGSPWHVDLEHPPVKSGGFAGEYVCGLAAGIGTLAALYARDISGLGQLVDVSKQEALMAINAFEISKYPNEGFVESRATRGYSIGGITQCKDGYIDLLPLEEHMWKNLVELMGNPDWTKDPRFQSRSSRAEHGEEVNANILEWTMNHSKEEIFHSAQAKGIAVGSVRTVEDLVNSEQIKHRRFMVDIKHPECGTLKYPSTSYRFSEISSLEDRPAPLLGQHNEDIYCGRLGYSKADLVKMRGLGTI